LLTTVIALIILRFAPENKFACGADIDWLEAASLNANGSSSLDDNANCRDYLNPATERLL
jgi:hypothetical protein